jgi:hypothetical protein
MRSLPHLEHIVMTVGLNELVRIAGVALEGEDRYILGCSAMRAHKGGITRFQNERYYQFVVFRGWLSRWDTTPERNLHDAVISVNGYDTAIIEMKCWRSVDGEAEIPSLKKDIEKLKNTNGAAFMIIFSANEHGKTTENLEFLYKMLPELELFPSSIYEFPTLSPFCSEAQFDFWVAGWQVREL